MLRRQRNSQAVLRAQDRQIVCQRHPLGIEGAAGSLRPEPGMMGDPPGHTDNTRKNMLGS